MITRINPDTAYNIALLISDIINELYEMNAIESTYICMYTNQNNSLNIALNCVYYYPDKRDLTKEFNEQLQSIKNQYNTTIIIQKRKSYYYSIVDLTRNGILMSQELVDGHIIFDKNGLLTSSRNYFINKRNIMPINGEVFDTVPSIPAITKKLQKKQF